MEAGSFRAAFKNTITSFVLIFAALILLKEILDINVTSLIATTTVLTTTIGLTFQSTLTNMLAGLTINLEKPVKQGDWIATCGHEGRVMDIAPRSTRILTIEHNEVFIPNSKVLSEAVVNYSMPDTTQVRRLRIGISFKVAANKAKSVILDILASVQGVSRQPEPMVRIAEYGHTQSCTRCGLLLQTSRGTSTLRPKLCSCCGTGSSALGLNSPASQ